MALSNFKLWLRGLFGDHDSSTDDVNDYVARLHRRVIPYNWAEEPQGTGSRPATKLAQKGGISATHPLAERVVFQAAQNCTVKSVSYAHDRTFSVCLSNSTSFYWTLTLLRRRNSTTSVSATAALATLANSTASLGGSGLSGRVGGRHAATLASTTDHATLLANDVITAQVTKTNSGQAFPAGTLYIEIEED